MIRIDQVSNQDFQLVRLATEKYTKEFGETYNFVENSIGFQFLVLEKNFKLQEDEIIETITDTIFQGKIGRDSGPDRGIDAIIINEEIKEISLFNFKYSDKNLENLKETNFQANEINNIIVFIKDLYEKNEISFAGNSANDLLKQKVKEIWKLIDSGLTFKYKIYFVSNLFRGLVEAEDNRITSELKKYKDVSFEYKLISDISSILTERKERIDSRFRVLSNNFFDKSDYGRRALIVEIPAVDLLRMVSIDEDSRMDTETSNEIILSHMINESVFSDNVRVYLKQKTNINKNIKNTALDKEENQKIFFYNNGITITCDKISYQGTRSQVVTINNMQIVNGGQTIHALRNAFEERQEHFDQITLLCKIYETGDSEFKNKIAEYTNSQNPVSDRDIHSIDSVQIKLEKEFLLLGYFYERKKSQYESQERNKRIDAEKLGQSLLAYKLEMPAEAKNRKSIIFGEKYEEIFNDKLLAKSALETLALYKEIEIEKRARVITKPYLLHATYYIMFFIKRESLISGNNDFLSLYEESLKKLDLIIQKEKELLGDDFSFGVLFKSSRPKEYLAELGL